MTQITHNVDKDTRALNIPRKDRLLFGKCCTC